MKMNLNLIMVYVTMKMVKVNSYLNEDTDLKHCNVALKPSICQALYVQLFQKESENKRFRI